MVRTRFAPSPTGFLHVGGARTALYAWLYAKHHNGKFILRIEDTDSERSTEASVQAILDGMRWLGLDADEGPYFQTQRYDRYTSVADSLLEQGLAYRCTCSEVRLNELREKQMQDKIKPRYDGFCRNKLIDASQPHVIRFKTPEEGAISFNDEVYGHIEVQNKELDDLILVRTDGHPTYNFAVVIDDWDMEITHVIRGDDHINNTPRQIHIYKALNAKIPVFAHLPMILGEDGKRLSKRHGAVGVMQFCEDGFLPEALLNYLVRLGWSHGDQEIFSIPEMIECFDLKSVSKGVSTFNYEKLYWLNQHYIKTLPVELVVNELKHQFDLANIDINQGPELTLLIPLMADRVKTLKSMCDESAYFYQDDISYDDEAFAKHIKPEIKESMILLAKYLENITDWKAELIHDAIKNTCETLSLGMGKVGMPLRVIVTGSTNSPSIDATLSLIGKKRTLNRLNTVISKL